MVKNNEKLRALKEDIRLTKANLRLLKKAKKECTCENKEPHYHELLNHDAESGDEYFEKSDKKHHAFIEKLSRNLVRLEDRLNKLTTQK